MKENIQRLMEKTKLKKAKNINKEKKCKFKTKQQNFWMKKRFLKNYFIFLRWHTTPWGSHSKLQNLHMARKGGNYITSINKC